MFDGLRKCDECGLYTGPPGPCKEVHSGFAIPEGRRPRINLCTECALKLGAIRSDLYEWLVPIREPSGETAPTVPVPQPALVPTPEPAAPPPKTEPPTAMAATPCPPKKKRRRGIPAGI